MKRKDTNPAPTPTLASEVAALRKLTVPELAAKYEEMFGVAPRVRHKEYLWKRCSWRLQERRTGGLSNVAKARLEALIAEIELPPEDSTRTVTGRVRPRSTNASAPAPPPKSAPRRATPHGVVYERQYGDEVIRAVAVPGGFEWNGAVYGSLSAVAKAATGSHWNGRLFFGLTTRKRGGRA